MKKVKIYSLRARVRPELKIRLEFAARKLGAAPTQIVREAAAFRLVISPLRKDSQDNGRRRARYEQGTVRQPLAQSQTP